MPKGVILTHGNIISTGAGAQGFGFMPQPDDVHISYLPLSHIMERIFVLWFTSCGCSIGFFTGNILKIRDDMAALRPTIFVSVPRLYNRFYALI